MLRLPDGSISMSADWEDLDAKLRAGDGLNFPGDPRLWLGVGVVKDRRGAVKGHRLEVWRDNEDGTSAIVGTWHPSELYRVCFDLAQMRAGAPGVKPVEVRIDEANARLEADASDAVVQELAPKVEHLAYQLVRDQGHAKTTFAVDGRA